MSEKRKTSQAQIDASGKYLANHYDRINLAVHKGDREKYKQYAKDHGMSLNQLFITAVKNYMDLSDNSDNCLADSD